MFDETITLYNKFRDVDTKRIVYVRSEIEGVSFVERQKTSVDKDGFHSKDTFIIRITDQSRELNGKTYINSNEWAKLDKDKRLQHYTLQMDDKIIKGSIDVDVKDDRIGVLDDFESACTILSISDNRSGLLPHLKVGGS